MHHRFAKRTVGLLLTAGLLAAFTGVAAADDFTSDAPATVTATQDVNVWVASVTGEGPWDNGDGCNIGNANDSHTVTAGITSSNPAVVVSPTSMTFETCGTGAKQVLHITATAGVCTVTGTITISKTGVDPNAHAVKGAFNTETIQFTVTGTNPTDPSCGNGGPPPNPGTCSEPAAPAWAAALLKASGIKPKPSGPNYISLVAQHMTQGAVFDGVPKSDQGTGTGDDYPKAVRSYMVNTLHIANLASIDDARLIRPGWDCTPPSA